MSEKVLLLPGSPDQQQLGPSDLSRGTDKGQRARSLGDIPVMPWPVGMWGLLKEHVWWGHTSGGVLPGGFLAVPAEGSPGRHSLSPLPRAPPSAEQPRLPGPQQQSQECRPSCCG